MQYTSIKLYNYKINYYVIFLYFISVVFSWTVLKHIFEIEFYSRIFNIIYLVSTTLITIHCLFSEKFYRNEWLRYILPSIIIFFSILLNFLLNSIDSVSGFSMLGMLMPWSTIMTVVFLLKRKLINIEILWKFTFNFFLFAIFFGLVDYYLIYFLGGQGSSIETPYGKFISGYFSIFHDIGNGSPHFRFYSCFSEPGNLAMFSIPFILYAYYKKKIFALIILLIAFFLTYSLGGLFSLIITFTMVMYYRSLNAGRIILLISIGIIFFSTNIYRDLENRLDSKQVSQEYIRQNNFIDGIKLIPKLIITNPFGISYKATTKENFKNNDYLGSNFIPLDYFYKGGVFAFLAYLFLIFNCIVDSLKILRNNTNINVIYKIVAISLISILPFLIQRTTIWETALFGWLFLPLLIKFSNFNKA